MKVRSLLHISLSLLLLSLSCCNRKKSGNGRTETIPPYYLGLIADYMYFKPGSYWVYKNSISGELDTVLQISCDTQFFKKLFTKDNVNYTYSYTLLEYTQQSSRNDCVIFNVPRHIYFPLNYLYSGTYNKTCTNPTGGGTNCNFIYPFDTSKTSFVGSATRYRGYIDSLQIEGKYYRDIRVFEVESDHTINNPTTSIPMNKGGKGFYYWAKGYGVIKIENLTYNTVTFDPVKHSWNLIESKIIK